MRADYYQMIEELSEIPQKMEKVLEQAPIIKDISRMFTYAHNFLYLGRGVNYPVAMEGALKLKEIADNVLEIPRTLNALVPLWFRCSCLLTMWLWIRDWMWICREIWRRV